MAVLLRNSLNALSRVNFAHFGSNARDNCALSDSILKYIPNVASILTCISSS